MAFWNENQADFNNPRMGQQPAMSAGREGIYNYLQDQYGYTGAMGPDMRQFMQGLRADGERPRMDYWRSMHPGMQMGQGGLGQLAGQMPQMGWGQNPRPTMPQGAWGGGYQNPTEPRPMNPGGMPQGIAVGEPNGGLASLRKPVGSVRR